MFHIFSFNLIKTGAKDCTLTREFLRKNSCSRVYTTPRTLYELIFKVFQTQREFSVEQTSLTPSLRE